MKPNLSLPGLILLLAAHNSELATTLAQSTINPSDHWGWVANVGWLDFRVEGLNQSGGARVCDTFLSGYAWSPNIGWIHLGDGTPANRVHYLNTDHADYGVNVDMDGNLSGLAWAANAGWINFGWASIDEPHRPRINLYHGYFFGAAWSANCGWINLGNSRLRTDSIAIVDTDNDGLSDGWELEMAGNLTTLAANSDSDGDGLTDKEEFLTGTNPLDAGSALRITALATSPTGATVAWMSRPSRQYQVYESTALTNGSWQLSQFTSIQASTAGPITQATVASTNSPVKYYRIAVLPTLAK